MKRFMWAGLIAAALLGTRLVAQKPQAAETLLQTAIKKEVVDGDLKGAIEQYKKIAQSGNRAVAAQALLHMAECYQKLGSADARRTYERLVREFADQTQAVAIARSHLGNSTASAGLAPRVLATTSASFDAWIGSVSSDGRYVAFQDWTRGGNIGVRDLFTGADRLVTNTATEGTEAEKAGRVKAEYGEEASFSRDGKKLAFAWFDGNTGRYSMRLVDLTVSGMPPVRTLFDDPDISWIGAEDWTPDGKWIAVHLTRKNRTSQFGLIAIADGSLKVVKSVDAADLFVSPDGKSLAYSEQGDIFMMPVEGGAEIPVVVHPASDKLMGWSPDGKYILFLSDRFSNNGLFALRVDANGPQGRSPQLLMSNIGPATDSMGLSRNGSLYYWAEGNRNVTEIQMAAFDFESERFLSDPVPVPSHGAVYSQPVWSPDGRYMALASGSTEVQRNSRLLIRELETGKTNELIPGIMFNFAVWAPDGRSLITSDGRGDIYRIDAETGKAAVVVAGGGRHNPEWCPDGSCIYYRRNLDGAVALIARDLSTGAERELIRRSRIGNANPSPDGRYLATFSADPSAGMAALFLIPTAGGAPREILRMPLVENNPYGVGGIMMWSPDSRSIFTNRINPTNGRIEIWRTSIEGQSHQVQIDMNKYGIRARVSVHRDGRRLLYPVLTSPGSSNDEIRVIDNVLSAISTSR